MKRLVRACLRRLGLDLVSRHIEVGFELLLRLQRLRSSSPFNFVQVGAQDGVTGDKIYEHVVAESWEGILVEPRGAMFARLKENYEGRAGLAFVQCAISGRAGSEVLFALDPEDRELPAWAHGLGSFDLEVLLKHEDQLPGIRERVVTEAVSCRTWGELFSEFPLPKVDLLQIDVEGRDFELLRLFPFRRTRPGLVRYEHKHLSPEDRVAAEALLVGLGYAPLIGPQDTVAFANSWSRAPASEPRT